MNASYKTAIKFKDLYIPVKMIKVSHNNSIELNQLCKDSKERVRYIKFCPSCNKEIHNEDIVKGYKYAEDKYVILEQYDIESITSNKDRTLSIKYFCKSKEISDLLIDKSYYLIPEMESGIEYELLRKAMTTNRVVGMAEIVLGTKQELVALFANKNCIIATILFYENEINELPIIMKHKTDKQQLENLKQDILDNTKEFDWESHYDKYQLKLRKLIFDKIPK
jgi:DNA end-binding protein Ku